MNAPALRSRIPIRSAKQLKHAVHTLDWDCVDADTRYLTHNIHRYSSKYIPQIARNAIELLTAPGERVLDPMVGSGTTLLEAWLLGRRAIGFDLNPLAVLISRVKNRRISSPILGRAVSKLLLVAESLESTDSRALRLSLTEMFDAAVAAARADSRRRDPWFAKWFQPAVLKDLLILDNAIQLTRDKRAQDLARVSLSDILRRSSNAHSGYPNVMFDRRLPPKPSPGPAFAQTLRKYADLVASLDTIRGPEPIADQQDARQLDLGNNSIDAIVSHPPYIGSVPYAEYGSLSLKWLGTDYKALDNELLGGRRQSKDVVTRFRASYFKVLGEAYRVLKPGRRMFLMVGDPVVRGDIVDLAAMTCELAADAGFTMIASAIRNGINRRANKMAHETLLFFEKPL